MTRCSVILPLLMIAALAGCPFSCQPSLRKQPIFKGVYFEEPLNNATVHSPFTVKMGVKGMQVKPAGENIEDQGSGHFHLLIDDQRGYIPEGEPIPFDEHHLHFGKGDTETTVSLPKGSHTLSIQFGDGAHRSYGKSLSDTITVNVVE